MASEQNGQGKRKKLLLLIGSIVGVALLAGGGGLLVRVLQEQATKTQAEAVAGTALKAQDQAAAGNFDAAHQTINEELKNANLTPEEKHNLLSVRGATYENQADYKNALAAYQEAAAVKETRGGVESIGRVAEQLGDKELAIASYKKAIQLIPDDRPTKDDTKKGYEAMIINLGGQP